MTCKRRKNRDSRGLSPYRSFCACVGVLAAILLVPGCGSGGSNAGLVGRNSVPDGAWGSSEGELDVSGIQVTFNENPCGRTTVNGPITPDANGDFLVMGQFASNHPLPAQEFIGHAQNGTMQLIVVDPTTNTIRADYTLIYGVKNDKVYEGCP